MKLIQLVFVAAFFLLTLTSAQANEKKILFVSADHSNKAKVTLIKQLAKDGPLKITQKSERDLGDLSEAKSFFEQYDLIILDDASARFTQQNFGKYAPLISASEKRFMPVKALDNTDLRNNLTDEQAQALFAYYDNGGVENFSRMLSYIRYRIFSGDSRVIGKPIVYPRAGIYHPEYDGQVFDSLSGYQTWLNQNGSGKDLGGMNSQVNDPMVIGLLIPRAAIEAGQTELVDATVAGLQEKGADVFAVFSETWTLSDDLIDLLQKNGETAVDVFINFRTIHFANRRKAEFEKLGKPVVQALTFFDGNQQDWEASEQGISPGMMAFTLVLPETAGVIDPTIVAAVNQETGVTEIIDYQLDFMLERVLKLAVLSKKPNHEKKITVMFWGDKDLGASFLNVPDSLHTISHRLHDEGYRVEPYEHDYYSDRADRTLNPFYRSVELEELLEDDLADLMPVARYRNWLKTLPEEVVVKVSEFWGDPEDNFMVVKRDGEYFFVIPRIVNGNMLIMRQPPRGDSKDQDQTLYHTTTVPMNHYYLAAYFYAREVWGSDAFIHLGTHGSQEYLPGKERGLSRYDGGNLSIGTVPVLYPFIVDDVGEAMQTKRRGGAVVISHMTPPYAAAGLQGVTADIHELMHQHESLDDGGVKQKTAAQIVDTCIEESLCKDFGWGRKAIDADFDGFLVALHDYLGELAAENQPLGLHSFGELAEHKLVISTVVQMLGARFIELASDFEVSYPSVADHHHKEGAEHHEHDENHSHDHDKQPQHRHDDNGLSKSDKDSAPINHTEDHSGHFHEASSAVEDLGGYKTVRDFVVGDADVEQLPEALREFVTTGKQYYQNMQNIQELDSLVKGLSGLYIPVKTGGDPIRHPESLPTGLNLYGFDPSRLPTKAAYEQGEELVEEMIANYYQEHNRYPDKMAFSLWSIEAMRHYGVLEGQAMKAMGVRPVWSDDGRVVDTEIIPASELKRPRVDVVLSATGLYRDAFPNVMQLLAKAVQQVAQLKEDNNSLWDNSQRIQQQLIGEGAAQDEAQYLSTVRIFSNASGQYGSGVDGPVFNSDTWETDAKIADNYLAKMGYAFGADNKRWGQKVDGLYGKQLSGTDVVAFSRSSNLYGMITSDDPFEYFGSLAMAVRNLDGQSPEMLISNLRDANKGKMEKASTFLAKELRTRNFNKRWIQEMQKEGYSGAVTMSANIANFWGWQVVDPNIVRDDQWQEFFEVYVEDKLELEINQWFEKVNPEAQAMLIERMLEAVRKNYWQANNATLQAMIERYQQLVTEHDLMPDSETLREYVNQQAAGFGLELRLTAPVEAPGVNSEAAPIEGQQLEKVEVSETGDQQDLTLFYLLFACVSIMLIGAIRQANFIDRRAFGNCQ
ncbi:MAG: cobaltochelatase subunit CobN [Pseudomonadales bacterium]|nr:cobaltochelatase subunit CobN [Pseudomonadales bacterium]MCP5170874.1 cobaltochelatase subunit CobN [Pseudomonadales bacterium]MCP5301886.1 cobaltochelatase subunit CobN [Pseudomonadales bacterium]